MKPTCFLVTPTGLRLPLGRLCLLGCGSIQPCSRSVSSNSSPVEAGTLEADIDHSVLFLYVHSRHLIGRNAGLERECNARSAIHPEFDGGEEAVGLVVREECSDSLPPIGAGDVFLKAALLTTSKCV
jgi:hypothetical protein